MNLRGLARAARRRPLGALGGFVVLGLVLVACLAPQLASHPPKDAAFPRHVAPGTQFRMGTDHLGRDVLSRVIWGARLSLYVGFTSVAVGITLGLLWGIFTAYAGGLADGITQRIVDVLMAIPPIILALALMAVLGPSIDNVVYAIVILLAPTAARTIRSVVLGIKTTLYIEAALALGCSHARVVIRHVLPNVLPMYVVLLTVNVGYAIMAEAALSFLGLGAPPDEPSWGGMLSAATRAIETAPWVMLFPGMAISLAVFGFCLLGDAFRDVTDPRLRQGLG